MPQSPMKLFLRCFTNGDTDGINPLIYSIELGKIIVYATITDGNTQTG